MEELFWRVFRNSYLREYLLMNRLEWSAINAARYGLIFIFKECGDELIGYYKDTMEWAAGRGHLRVVQWLHKNRTEGCTYWAMDWAAGNGYLDVVQWLHENRTEGCTRNAMDYAALNGHLRVVQWLHENRTEGCNKWTMDWAGYNGHLDVVEYLKGLENHGF